MYEWGNSMLLMVCSVVDLSCWYLQWPAMLYTKCVIYLYDCTFKHDIFYVFDDHSSDVPSVTILFVM